MIRSLSDIPRIRLEMKNGDDKVYQYLDEINSDNYFKKTVKDSVEYLNFSYLYKPIKNGVYFLKIKLIDKDYHIKYNDEIKIGVSDITEFKLFQNSPNPFNPAMSIGYELYTDTNITLKIYSMDGKEVETLVDEFQNAGVYRIEFNATKYTELSGGIYFYKLQTNYSSDIKKMIFTK
jgi:hypothetical protein